MPSYLITHTYMYICVCDPSVIKKKKNSNFVILNNILFLTGVMD